MAIKQYGNEQTCDWRRVWHSMSRVELWKNFVWIGRDVEGHGCGLLSGNVPEFTCGELLKISVMTADRWSEFPKNGTNHYLNVRQVPTCVSQLDYIQDIRHVYHFT
jgi:hypothetical protein